MKDWMKKERRGKISCMKKQNSAINTKANSNRIKISII